MKQFMMALVAAGLLMSVSVAQEKVEKKDKTASTQCVDEQKDCAGMDCCKEMKATRSTKAIKASKSVKAAKTVQKDAQKRAEKEESKQ